MEGRFPDFASPWGNIGFLSVSPLETFGEIGIVVHDEKGKISQVNSCFCRMFGYDPAEVIGKDLDLLVAREEELVDALALSERFCGSGKGFSVEVTRYKKDGTPFQVLLTSTPMYVDVKGSRSTNICTYIDLTQKREKARELHRTLILFENLFKWTPTPVVLCDNESRVIRANASLYRLFGYTPEEMEGRIIDYLIAHGPYLEEAREISSILFSGKPHERRTVRFRKDGARWTSSSPRSLSPRRTEKKCFSAFTRTFQPKPKPKGESKPTKPNFGAWPGRSPFRRKGSEDGSPRSSTTKSASNWPSSTNPCRLPKPACKRAPQTSPRPTP